MEVISESKCVSKVSEIILNDLFYVDQPPCICDAEISELKQQNFKLANVFKKLQTLDYGIGHHLMSLKLFITILCYSPSLQYVIINGRSPIEGIDPENLCYKEMEELIAALAKKKKKTDDLDEFAFILDITVPRITEQLKARKLSNNMTDQLLDQSVALVSGELSHRVEYQGISLAHHLLLNVLGGDEEEGEEDEEEG